MYMRSLAALEMWRKFMIGLRIKERVDGYEIDGEEATVGHAEQNVAVATEMDGDEDGGGFLPVDEEGTQKKERFDTYGDGGFLPRSMEDITEKGEYVDTRHNEDFVFNGESNNPEKGEETNDDPDRGSVPVEEDSGMESEEYIDDGGGGFLSE